MKRIATSVSLVLVLALIGFATSGCGGSKSASSSGATTAVKTIPVITDPAVRAFADPINCGDMEFYGSQYVLARDRGEANGPERVALQKLLDKGPPGVRKDFSVMANACGLVDMYYALSK